LNNQDILDKHQEELQRKTIICAYIAFEHTKAKDEIKSIKEQIKERKEIITKQIGDKK